MNEDRRPRRPQNDRKDRGPFIPQEELAYWVPIPHTLAEKVSRIREVFAADGKRMGPFQVVHHAIEKLAESMNV